MWYFLPLDATPTGAARASTEPGNVNEGITAALSDAVEQAWTFASLLYMLVEASTLPVLAAMPTPTVSGLAQRK